MPTLESALKVLELPPRYLTAIAIFCGGFLLAPDRLLERLGVFDVAKNYRQWFAVLFFAALALLAVHGCAEIGRAVRKRSRLQKAQKRALETLYSLSEDQKKILRFYVTTQKKTNKLRIDDGVVNGLVAAGLIHLAARRGHVLNGFDHNISEFAWEYLHKHPELLEGATDDVRTDDRRDRSFDEFQH